MIYNIKMDYKNQKKVHIQAKRGIFFKKLTEIMFERYQNRNFAPVITIWSF